MSLLSDMFSIRRHEACISMKASADGQNRPRRRSLSAKCQSILSSFSQDFRSAIDSDGSGNLKANKNVDSTTPPSPVPEGQTTFLETLTPVTIIEPRESQRSTEDPEIPEKSRLRRRPKTPIRRIGELEGYSKESMGQGCVDLAREYQATCAFRPPASPISSRSLRKIGGQHDLRRTSIDSDSGSRSPNLSDVETVVGSESLGARPRRLRNDSSTSCCSAGSSWSSNSTNSYYSAASEKVEPKDTNAFPKGTPNTNTEISIKPLDFTHNIEMQICLDLLKQDLSSALSPKNPADSTLALQLWLMIESYESMKQRLHQQLLEQTGPGSKRTSEFTFQALDHWLEALYSVYNLQLQRCQKVSGINQVNA